MFNQRLNNLTPYVAGEQPQNISSFVKLNTNENPYAPSGAVQEVLESFDYSALRLYPDPNSTKLVQAIAKIENVAPENVFVGNGSDEILGLAFLALFNQNASKPVVFANITYSFYPVYCNLYGINYATIALKQDFAFSKLDYLCLDCEGIVIANPNAPTGIFSCDIESVIKTNAKVPVIVDEAYIDFAGSGKSAVKLIKKYENALIVKTFSKSYSLAGLRVGYAIADSKIIALLNKVKNSFNSYPLDRLAIDAATAAVLDTDYLTDTTKKIINTRDNFVQNISGKAYVVPSSANFVFVKHKNFSGLEFYTHCKNNGFLVRHFNNPLINDFVRISIGTDEQMDKLCKIF